MLNNTLRPPAVSRPPVEPQWTLKPSVADYASSTDATVYDDLPQSLTAQSLAGVNPHQIASFGCDVNHVQMHELEPFVEKPRLYNGWQQTPGKSTNTHAIATNHGWQPTRGKFIITTVTLQSQR